MEEVLVPLFRGQENISVVHGAGQNIDRIVSVYRACKKAGKKLLINPYIAHMLSLAEEKSEPHP